MLRNKRWILFLPVMALMPWLTTDVLADEAWLDAGWKQLERGFLIRAVETWQRGVDSLPDDRVLLVLGIFKELQSAIKLTGDIGQHDLAFTIQGNIRGISGYYVLTAHSAPADKAERRKQFAALIQRLGARQNLHGYAAKRFKRVKTELSGRGSGSPEAAPLIQPKHPSGAKTGFKPVAPKGRPNRNAHRKLKSSGSVTEQWRLRGDRTLRENLQQLTSTHGWRLVWDIQTDYAVGASAEIKGSIKQIVRKIVDAYRARGVLLKIIWFQGNRVMQVQRAEASKRLGEAGA